MTKSNFDSVEWRLVAVTSGPHLHAYWLDGVVQGLLEEGMQGDGINSVLISIENGKTIY